MSAVLLCYHISAPKAQKLRLIAMRWKVRLRTVSDGELGLPVQSLLSSAGGAAAAAPFAGFPDEMLILANFPGPVLNAFLNDLRRQNASVELKAVLTPSNAEWTSLQLYNEIKKEHEALNAGKGSMHQ